jgi:hypothetical protein
MNTIVTTRHVILCLTLLGLACGLNLALAQTASDAASSGHLPVASLPEPTQAVPVPPVAATSAPLPAPAGVVSPETPAATLTPLVPTSLGAAPAALGCRPLSDQAMAMDLSAVTAQSKKAELATQVKLFTEALDLWTQAVQQCDGRAKERAQRNRDDDQQMLDRVAEKMDSGPQCAAAHKDASALQDIARQSLADRHWLEAAALFRKAENMWDDAAERCTGSQQIDANQRREQSAQDGYNAEHCAPLFERAREHTQKLRGAAGGMSKEDKQEAQMVAETLWREALGKCKGRAVRDIATNNAQTLARERGTPWVPRLAPAPTPASALALAAGAASLPVTGTRSGVSAATPMALAPAAKPTSFGSGLASSLATASPEPSSKAESKSFYFGSSNTALAPSTLAVPPVASKPAASPTQTPGDMLLGTTRFVGQFARDADANTVSGTGRVTWDTGEVFEGTMVNGLRSGKGSFTWANGQRYDGDWVQDKPTGQARVHFANGNDFEGPVVEAVPQGQGRMRYASGDTFDGIFKNGEPDQMGVYVWRSGQRYDGTWKDGRPDGEGKLKFANGNQFEGQLAAGLPQGQGRLAFAGGEVYTGQFQAGEPDGEGSFVWPSGDQYVGQWKKGKKHGKGVFTWKSGDRWEGLYENDAQKQ